MVSVSDLTKIMEVINHLRIYPISEDLYNYLEIWYPYLVTFLFILCLAGIFSFPIFKDKSISEFLLTLAAVFIIPGLIFYYFRLPIPNKSQSLIIALFFFAFAILLIFLVKKYHENKQMTEIKELIIETVVVGVIVSCAIGISFLILFASLYITSYDGNITVGHISADIDPEYTIGSPINVPIIMGGPNTGLSITLLSEDSGTLNEISSLNLHSYDSSNRLNDTLKFNGNLAGKATNSGKYTIYINTTSLDPGYYYLRFENPKYKNINSLTVFHLSK